MTNRLSLCCVIVSIILLSNRIKAAEPDHAALVVPELKLIFEERFDVANRPESLNQFLRDIRQITPGGFEIGKGQLLLQPSGGPSIMVRPAATGPVAQLTVKLD